MKHLLWLKRHRQIVAGLLALTLIPSSTYAQQNKPNVLLLSIDDLRVQYGPYDIDNAKTPRIDKLASQGVAFTHAYSSVPVCGASRASMLTGVWPTSQRFVAFNSADKDAPWAKPFPQVFKENGYTSLSLGKVFNNKNDHPQAWSEPPWRPRDLKNEDAVLTEGMDKQKILMSRHDYQTEAGINMAKRGPKQHPAFEVADVDDDIYKNGEIAERAIDDLARLKEQGQPFFLAVGLLKPHLPFNAPRKYWDMYDANDIKLTATPNMAKGAPAQAYHNWGELRNYGHGGAMPKKGDMPEAMARKLIHGYYASTSYTDALIGKILDALERLNLADNTIVVLWGDHGWSLGEHGLWAKHSSYNVANHIPLIFRVPPTLNTGVKEGIYNHGLVESVDIFPTLTALTGMQTPSSVHGKSLLPMLKDPAERVNDAVYPRWQNADSIRTERYFYTEWRDQDNGKVIANMLFDHDKDPTETVNLADSPSHQTIVKTLHDKLVKHIRLAEKTPVTSHSAMPSGQVK